MIYLASPYSHPDPEVRQARHDAACRCAARLMAGGQVVFSPIAHSHAIAAFLPPVLCMSWGFWKSQDFPLLEKADTLLVLRLDGWEQSVGVAAEIARARELGIPVRWEDE
jgi:hypothetical protein